MKPNICDWAKMAAIVGMRYVNELGVEHWSKLTFRQRRPAVIGPVELERACDHYASAAIPPILQVAKETPAGAKLSIAYKLLYYDLDGGLFTLYRFWPIRKRLPWSRTQLSNRVFPRNDEGWEDANTDAGYTRLRIQGPNPYLLQRTDEDEEGGYEVDYSPYFRGVFAPVRCRFRLRDGRLEPVSISIGEEAPCAPGDQGWERAKLVANALDARYTVFIRHLLDTHLLIGQGFALAAFALPAAHRLRAFLDFFTYGTLDVNDCAYKLLLTPASYFIQGNFISAQDSMTMFQNSVARFSLEDMVVPKDVAKRGIDQIPGHPYVEDALEAWGVLHAFVEGYVGEIYADDAAVAADQALHIWHATLASLLPGDAGPGSSPLVAPITRAALAELLTCLVYNNVDHGICGDFSPYGQSLDAEHKKLIDFERIKRGERGGTPSAADVFLFDQGAYAGRFVNGGNRLLTIPVDRFVTDPALILAITGLQSKLRTLDRRLEERNKLRQVPFHRIMPRNWEISVAF